MTTEFNARNGLSVGGTLGTTPVPAIDNTGLFTPVRIVAPGIYENASTITVPYQIGLNNNALSAGPVGIAPGANVSIQAGSVWKII